MLISEAVNIWRDAEGDYHLEWDSSAAGARVAVEALAEQPHTVEHYQDDAVARARVSGLPENRRHYFRLCDEGGVDKLKEVNFHRPESELQAHLTSLETYFQANPPATIKEAQSKIES